MDSRVSSFVLLLFFTFSIVVHAQADHRNLDDKLAIQGYDPVAYFTESKAVKGEKRFQVDYNGAIYYFSSIKHQKLFQEHPKKYTPEYGGWCAYAMGDSGEKVSIDPETFKIIDEKLYLFYHTFLSNTLNSWNKVEKHLQQQADKNWSNLTH